MVQGAVLTAGQANLASAALPEALVERVLAPYKPHCRYLRCAWLLDPRGATPSRNSRPPLAIARGTFSIPESCYIADTGHFNAVEFNICYNQLAYVLVASCVQRGWLPPLAHWTLEEFLRRQLTDCLIVNLATEFRAPLRSEAFEGVLEIQRARMGQGSVFMPTNCEFRDARSGLARGEVLLAVFKGGLPRDADGTSR